MRIKIFSRRADPENVLTFSSTQICVRKRFIWTKSAQSSNCIPLRYSIMSHHFSGTLSLPSEMLVVLGDQRSCWCFTPYRRLLVHHFTLLETTVTYRAQKPKFTDPKQPTSLIDYSKHRIVLDGRDNLSYFHHQSSYLPLIVPYPTVSRRISYRIFNCNVSSPARSSFGLFISSSLRLHAIWASFGSRFHHNRLVRS